MGKKKTNSLKEKAERETENLSSEEWTKLICKKCQFYHPGEENRLECGGFKILKILALRGKIQPADIAEAAAKIKKKK
jgi:hypothetical protein